MVIKRYFLLALLLSSVPLQAKMPCMQDECRQLTECDKEMMARYEGVDFVQVPVRVRELLCAMQDDIRSMDRDNVLPALSSEMSVAPAAGMHTLATAVVKACEEGCTIGGCDESTEVVKKIFQEYVEMLESGLASVACNQEMTRSCKTKNYPRLTTNSLRVNGSGCFTRNVCIGGQLGVVGDTTLRGNLIVDGTTTFAGGTILGGDLTVEGNLTVDGTSTLVGLVTAEAGISLPNQSNEVSGFAGSNGPLFQHARFYATANAGPVPGAADTPIAVPLGIEDPTNSAGITISGGDTITFATAGLYLITYGINAATANTAGQTINFSVLLGLNGVADTTTRSFGSSWISAGGVGAVGEHIFGSSSVILELAAGDTIDLRAQYDTTSADGVVWPTPPMQQAYVNISQLA